MGLSILLLLKNWEILLGKRAQIRELMPAHWNGTLSFKGFENRCHYIKTLWEGVNRSAKEGKPVESLDRQAYYASLAHVSCETFLFHDTIRANFLLANPRAFRFRIL